MTDINESKNVTKENLLKDIKVVIGDKRIAKFEELINAADLENNSLSRLRNKILGHAECRKGAASLDMLEDNMEGTVRFRCAGCKAVILDTELLKDPTSLLYANFEDDFVRLGYTSQLDRLIEKYPQLKEGYSERCWIAIGTDVPPIVLYDEGNGWYDFVDYLSKILEEEECQQ